MPSPPSMVLSRFGCKSFVVLSKLHAVFLFVGFDLTSINVSFVAVVSLRMCCCSCFFVGLWIELLDILNFVALLRPSPAAYVNFNLFSITKLTFC